ncbi:MAG: hypothetical protein U0840_23630 [Gemmataceae bacterium]
MRFTSRHWRTGSLQAAALLVGSLIGLTLAAQAHGQRFPSPGVIPRSGGGNPEPGSSGSVESEANLGMPPSAPRMMGVQRQGDLLRYSRNIPADAKPIVLEANEVFSWNENGKVGFLLSGQVLVQQSVVQARCEQAVVWVDTGRYQQTGILHMDLYAEGKVRLDTSVEIQDGNRAVLDLNTRGEFRIRGSRGKVQKQNRSGEAIVRRASEVGVAGTIPGNSMVGTPVAAPPPAAVLPPVPGVAPSSVIQPTSGSSGSSGAPPLPGVQPPPGVGPASPGLNLSSRQGMESGAKPGATSPARPYLVRAQGNDPEPARGVTTPLPSPAAGSPAPPTAPPGQVLPSPMPSRVPLPPPPSQEQPSRRDSQRQPGVEPPPGQSVPAPQLPPPTPGSEGTTTPLPPPSRPVEPPRPGELPKQSSPDRPLAHRLLPRSGDSYNLKIDNLPNGEKVITASGGVILNVRNVPKIGVLDVEADRAVVWVRNRDRADKIADNLRSDQGETSTELEFYMAGHVVLRSNLNDKDSSVLEAEELYYDARRNVAVALQSRLELRTQRLANKKNVRMDEPIVLAAPELFRTGPNTFEVTDARVFSSKLPSDPGLQLLVAKATLTNRERPRTFFGQPVTDKKGNPVMIEESIVEAKNVFAELEGVPFYYSPYLITDARDPLGPLQTITLGGNSVFGFQGGVGLDVYKLFGLQPIENTRWRFLADYLSRRGPALGMNFDYGNIFESMVDPDNPYNSRPYFQGIVRTFGIYDQATDILGGNRPPDTLTFDPPGYRGRALWRQGAFDMTYGFDVVAQMSLLSDRNFLEQYFKREFDSDPNQANFLFVKQQQDNWAWYAVGQPRTSNWITTTQWLPRADGFLLGQDLFGGLLTSNTQVSLAYADLRLSSDPPLPLQGAPNPPGYPEAFFPTDRNNQTGRFAILQELGLPVDLGAFRIEPYLKGALAQYTNDLSGNELGRAWGGGGVRASLPLSRLYPDVDSELFNLKGMNHKMVFGANYFASWSNQPYTKVAQLDRLNDDATAEMLRDFKPYEPVYNPAAGFALATSPYFDPQTYAIRRLVDNRIDTLEGIQVLQVDLRQRLQTKRGFPGAEHIIDWMTLDTSFSYFPQPSQNFGEAFSFLEYQYNWNIGDRTTIESYGWYDPQDFGARVFTIGGFFNRPDRTMFYVGYRQIDPLDSRLFMASLTYTLSPKYALTMATSYDFGTNEAQTNTVVLTRTGSDLQVSLGFMYNSLQNNFGAIVEIVPSLVPINRRGGGMANTSMMAR